MANLTAKRLRELLHYNPETGHFTWKVSVGSRGQAGSRAGCNYGKTGWLLRVDGDLYLGARLAWLYMKGAWPKQHIHRHNDQVDDLRWNNLYEASRGEKLPPPARASGKPLTVERIKKLILYDPKTGVFTWRNPISNRLKAGDEAGFINDRGYVLVNIDGAKYRGHHLAWFYVYGEWPAGKLDHRDLDRSNNRIDNLRPATDGQNQANRRAPINNTTGFKGVYWLKHHNRWLAKVVRNSKQIHIGLFATPEDAYAAYCAKVRELDGEFARVD